MRIIKLVLFTTLIVFVVFSCESPVSDQAHDHDRLEDVPESDIGSMPLPVGNDVTVEMFKKPEFNDSTFNAHFFEAIKVAQKKTKSEYVIMASIRMKNGKYKYHYRKVKIPGHQSEVKEPILLTFRTYVKPDTLMPELLAAAFIPNNEYLIEDIKKWYKTKVSPGKSQNRPKNTYAEPEVNEQIACFVEEGTFFYLECMCFGLGTVEVCESSGGGGSDPFGDEPDYSCSSCPAPPTGGGGGSEDGDSEGSGEDEETDCSNQFEISVECAEQDTLLLPCFGDPLVEIEIAPSAEGYNMDGGRKGWTRTENNAPKYHAGIDLKAPIGTNVFPMRAGVVRRIDNGFDPTEYEQNSYGNQVVIESIINGRKIFFRYAHLGSVIQDIKINDIISLGQVIGTSGKSGNAGDKNGKPQKIIPHLHVEVYDATSVNSAQKVYKNPEDYLNTEFSADGSVTNPCNQ